MRRPVFFIFPIIFVLCFLQCAPPDLSQYQDLSTPNGRQILMDKANNYLTSAMCDQAIDVLSPLINSPYVNYEARMLYAAGWACKGGMNFASLVFAIKDAGSDIWAALVKANYARDHDTAFLKIIYFERAAEVLRQSAGIPGSYEAGLRTADANVFMIFIQLNIISSIIAPLGVANRLTGKKTVAGWGPTALNHYACWTQVAIAVMLDSLIYVVVSAAVQNSLGQFSTFCGGACPTNKIFANCTMADVTAGRLGLVGIDSQWTLE